ncbi:MAG: Vps4 C terminal oligomerization domain-containing protein [Olpidium bornovanus]|uniref:Vps4 C terminal oligomerization domain-containing protein n=1 Tax=Olpidium bornovanus TaxID=278681 RepID=A0A8H7ZZ75_9FUNG|nr:MAG: Vps4 C terminal oligomerization domain-containing protein [Olpidium bornovanus]
MPTAPVSRPQLQVQAPSRKDPSKVTPHLTPCSPGDSEATEMTWMQVQSDQLLEPALTVYDFLRAVKTGRPTVNEKDLAEHEKFTQDFGQASFLFSPSILIVCPGFPRVVEAIEG